MGSGLWSIATIIGPLLLIAIIIWAVLSNRRSPREEARTEQETRRLYDRLDAEDKARDEREARRDAAD